MIATPTDPIVLKYFSLPNGLGGRGGVQRFFLLANGIPFTEEQVDLDYWFAEGKAKSLASGENPCGSLPVVFVGRDEQKKKACLSQHISSSRYLARVHGVTKGMSAYEEYVQDLVADEYMDFCAAWVHAVFEGSEDEKEDFLKTIPTYLTKFDQLYAKFKTDDVYLSKSSATGNPLWGDAAMFGLIRDNVITGFIDVETLAQSYTNLWDVYELFGNIAPVKEWLDKH
jgi:Glutathione S-transferase, C-terminal domain